jgi:hypothetical protein
MQTRLLVDLRWMILQIHDSNECAKIDLDFKKRECSNYQTNFDISGLSSGFPDYKDVVIKFIDDMLKSIITYLDDKKYKIS